MKALLVVAISKKNVALKIFDERAITIFQSQIWNLFNLICQKKSRNTHKLPSQKAKCNKLKKINFQLSTQDMCQNFHFHLIIKNVNKIFTVTKRSRYFYNAEWGIKRRNLANSLTSITFTNGNDSICLALMRS